MTTTKLRFVRCPRCSQVLPELPDILVYECGGCGTILQAKKRKNGIKQTGSCTKEANIGQKNESVTELSENKKVQNISQVGVPPTTTESALDNNTGRDQNEIGHGKQGAENCGGSNNLSEHSTEIIDRAKEESSPDMKAEREADQDDGSLEQNTGRDQIEHGNDKGKQPGEVNSTNEFAPSTELDQCEAKELSSASHNYKQQPGKITSTDSAAPTIEFDQHPSEELSAKFVNHSRKLPRDSNDIERAVPSAEFDQQESEALPLVAENCNGKLPGYTNSTHKVAPTDLNQHERDELVPATGDSDGKPPGEFNSTDEFAPSTELNQQWSEELSPLAETYYGKLPGDVNSRDEVAPLSELDQHECEELSPVVENYNGKQPGEINSTNNIAMSTELNQQPSEGLSPAAETHNVPPPENINSTGEVTPSTELDHHESEGLSPIAGNYNEKQSRATNSSGEVTPSTGINLEEREKMSSEAGHSEITEQRICLGNDGSDQHEFDNCRKERPRTVNSSHVVSSSINPTCQEIEEPAPRHTKMEEVGKAFATSAFRISSVEDLQAATPSCSITTTQRLSSESILTDDLGFSNGEYKEQRETSSHQGLDHVSSVDTLADKTLENQVSKVGVTVGDTSKSPTTRSSIVYNGSVSSYDGIDDQNPDRCLPLPKRRLETAFANRKALPGRDEVMFNNIPSSSSEMQNEARNFPSSSLPRRHRSHERRKQYQDKLNGLTRHHHLVRSTMKLDTDECLTGLPFAAGYSQANYDNGSPSHHRYNNLDCSPRIRSSYSRCSAEEQKMELLKKFYELQDQLNGIYISEGKANQRFPGGVAGCQKDSPSWYDHPAAETGPYHDLNYSTHFRRCNHGKSWSHQCQHSRMAFSAEATTCRHHVDHSGLQCCPRDRHYSAELPPHMICCNRGQYTAHPTQRCYNHCCSGHSSPQHYPGSESSSWSSDRKSGNQWHINHITTKHIKERTHSVKRHIRPVAGGAPLVACYHCSKLLQLPEDFLLSKGKRSHKLRCSACSVVLRFSLENGSRILPSTSCAPVVVAPPPSEANDQSDAMSEGRLASTSYANSCPHVDPVSCSDDYGLSLCKSCSTEGEPFSATLPSHVFARNSNIRKMSSGSSVEPVEETKNRSALERSKNKFKNPVESFTSAGPSKRISNTKKPCSEIEELPSGSNSLLHRLMGYSSPSQVIHH